MATWTPQSKTTAGTFTNTSRAIGETITVGTPTGLLLSITYATQSGSSPWTKQTKASNATFTNTSKS